MNYRERLTELKGKVSLLEEQKRENNNAVSRQKRLLTTIEKSQLVIQKVAMDTQNQLRISLEAVVQSVLDATFPGRYEFKVEFDIARGKTEANIQFLRNGRTIDPLEASGGGVVDVASFALRLSVYTLSSADNVLILDEPFKFVSIDIRPLAVAILKELSNKLNVQIIMVSHDKELIEIADTIHNVSIVNGVSVVETTKGI